MGSDLMKHPIAERNPFVFEIRWVASEWALKTYLHRERSGSRRWSEECRQVPGALLICSSGGF